MLRNALVALASTVVAASSAVAVQAAPASASSPDDSRSVAEMSARWLAKDQGLRLDTARQRVTTQDRRSTLGQSLERALGSRAAGSYLDQKSGTVVVNVLDRDAAAAVTRKGAKPRIVKHDNASLERSRSAASARLGRGVVSSYVDPVTNAVVVTVPAADLATSRAAVRGLSGVRVEGTTANVSTQANVYGGQQIEFSGYVCSLGFNATRSGTTVFITAGHCAEGNQTFTRNGTYLGKTQAYSFPGNDYAYSSLSSSWTGVGAVSQYNGYARRVSGSSNAAVGTAVCKSGRTTGWTCGAVKAKNVSVNYSNGDGTYTRVSGLTQSNTCTEGGDSGGSWLASTLAQGVTSGGAGYGPDGLCGEKVGQPNIAYFQPVGEILSAYGLTLKIS